MTDIYPSSEQVMEYLSSYAKHFQLLRCIKFGHRVTGIEFTGVEESEMREWDMWSENGEAFGKGRGEWHLTVQKAGLEQTEVCEFSTAQSAPRLPQTKNFLKLLTCFL